MRPKDFKLSIVTPFYNEQDGGMIDVYFTEVKAALAKITENWEIIAVDDGSTDDSFALLKAYHQKDKRIKIIKLARNFGKEAALTAGLHHCNGDATVPMDADLQDPPYLLEEMIKHWQNGYDMVIPLRDTRDDPLLKTITANLFYWCFARIVSKKFITKHSSDFRLLDKKTLHSISALNEQHRFMKALLNWSGFRKKIIHYRRDKRQYGQTKYNYQKMFAYALDGIFSFSIAPIRLVFIAGFIISLLSFSYGAFLIYKQLFLDIAVPGYTSIMVGILFLGGVQMIALGIIGEYVGRIYQQVKQRPLYVIDELLSEK
ncbi:MAG: glycosyltransferase family 2 protein [Alphaproteobacteria bacterium]|nr:glycosyltransferase family 2 protein [Alphaproteobacteria bacterium]